jgi:hypothetical protein
MFGGQVGGSQKTQQGGIQIPFTAHMEDNKKSFFKEIQDNLWLFEFDEDSDRKCVLEGRPWCYERSLLILNEFDWKTPPSQMEFNSTPI